MTAQTEPYLSHRPALGAKVYIHPAATVIGRVCLGDAVSVWPGAVIRGDVNTIAVGARSNIQDLSVLHVGSPSAEQPEGAPLIVGEDVTVGHRAILHGCRIGNRVLIGMGSMVLDHAIIEDEVMLGAGSLVPPGKTLQSGWLYLGSPAKAVRELTAAERESLATSAAHYVKVAADYLGG